MPRPRGGAALVVGALAIFLAGCGSTKDEGSAQAALRDAQAIPCAPEAVLVRVCQQCHANPMRNGAPFPLVTYADTRDEIDGEPLAAHMLRALESERMPLPPVQITPAEREELLAWLRGGAVPRDPAVSCE